MTKTSKIFWSSYILC